VTARRAMAHDGRSRVGVDFQQTIEVIEKGLAGAG
jgi:hypothetical protein